MTNIQWQITYYEYYGNTEAFKITHTGSMTSACELVESKISWDQAHVSGGEATYKMGGSVKATIDKVK